MTLTRAMIAGAAALIGLAASGPAQADVTMKSGNIPGPAGNVLHHVTPRSSLIDLTKLGSSRKFGGGGQANVGMQDGPFDDPVIAFADGSAFDYLIFNIDVLNVRGQANGGTTTFTASLVGKPDVTQSFTINRNGQNFFTVQATGGDAIRSFRIASDVALSNVNHVRLHQAAAPVPEPGEWAMMLAGLGVVGWMAKRQRASAAYA